MKRVICIWLPAWPLQRLVVARPELKSQPVVLHARDPRRGQRVVACNRLAQQVGVVADMPLAEVAALRKNRERSATESLSAPTVWQLFEHEPHADDKVLAELAIWCEQFSPIVGFEESPHPDCLLLDVTALAHLFGGEDCLVEAILDAFHQRGYRPRVAIADTLGAAWALAHYGESRNGSDESSVEALPVAALRLDPPTLETLSQLGVVTIAQLLQLPRKGLATRLGSRVIQRIDQVLGKQPEVITAHRAPPEFTAEWILEHPTGRRDVLEKIMAKLCVQLTKKLADHDHAAVQVEAWLKGQKRSIRLPICLFQPSSNPRHIEELLRLQLESTQMRDPVCCLHLVAVTTVRIHGGQHLLWEEAGQGDAHALAPLVDRLSSRLGKENVFRVQPRAGALPERAYREQTLADTLVSRRKRNAPATSSPIPQRPLWLQEPPQPLDAVTIAATAKSADSPPAFFLCQNKRHDVARHWGPERIETGWWRGTSVRRDYYRIETDTGSRFWIFRRLSDGAWFLHGCFE